MSGARPTIVIERPASEIFAFITDLSQVKRWAPAMGPIDATGRIREGLAFREERRIAGIRTKASWRITEFVPDRTLGFRVDYGPMHGDLTYHFEPLDPSRTRLTQDVLFRLAGPLAPLSGMLTGEARREEERELVRLKALLEGDRPGP